MNNSNNPVTNILMAINVIVFLAFQLFHLDLLAANCALWFAATPFFHIWQPVTYMFLHASWGHLFFNMFSLWMFGRAVEPALGTRRYLLFYFVCGIGAAICQEVWQLGELLFVQDASLAPTVGASGACYGILLAFGMMYPEQRILLLFPPIPMKAKYFVVGYAAIELFSAFATNGNIAHFAHLGGMFFGWLLFRFWRYQAQRIQRRRQQQNTWSHPEYDYNQQERERENRVDELLDKVRRSGYDSLTEEEKRDLFRLTRR